MSHLRDIGWRRSTKCATGGCAEVKVAGDHVLVRSSRRPQVELLLSRRAFSEPVGGVKAGAFSP